MYDELTPDRAVAVVAFGGGHGLHASLSALRLLVDELVVDDLTAVVTVADNGGSSGRLRGEFGVLPPGDLRMALAALCGRNEWGVTWSRVLQHRFAGEGEMRDHVVGNLLIVGLWELLGDHVDALDYVGRLLGATGRVLPMALVPMDITAEVRGLVPGDPDALTSVRGQVEVATTDGDDRLDRAGAARPAGRARGAQGHRGRRLGGARPGLVVHLGDPAPHGPGAAPGAGQHRRAGRSWCSTSRPRRARRPGSARPTTSRSSPSTRPTCASTRSWPTSTSAGEELAELEHMVAAYGARLVVDDVAEAPGTPATTRVKLAAAYSKIIGGTLT